MIHGVSTFGRTVGKPKNKCFGCGLDNPDGMRLKFDYDEEGNRFLCKFRLSRRYMGPPGHAHGGIIATILDEVMGKPNRVRQIMAMTREMTVEYLKPVPLGQPLVAEGREVSVHGRLHLRHGEIRNADGQVLARAQGKFIAVDPHTTFSKPSAVAAVLQSVKPAKAGRRNGSRRP